MPQAHEVCSLAGTPVRRRGLHLQPALEWLLMDRQLVGTSKFLSLVLRHSPERIGLTLEHGGWASVPELIRLANDAGHQLMEQLLHRVVAENDKQRFALTSDGAWIRANQGHSIQVDLGLDPLEPPESLYHGTATRNVDSIRRKGLLPGRRQHVHLSPDERTAVQVGRRHGTPVVLLVDAGSLHRAGAEFFRSSNGVWLTSYVPAAFIRFPRTAA
jgi:putative RNA 2'-phosphotransferase